METEHAGHEAVAKWQWVYQYCSESAVLHISVLACHITRLMIGRSLTWTKVWRHVCHRHSSHVVYRWT